MRDRGFSSFFLSSSPDRPPLRVGILLDHQLDRVAVTVLDDLRAADFVVMVVVLFEADPVRPVAPSLRRVAWDLYKRLDRRRVRLADNPLDLVDRTAALHGLDALAVRPIVDGATRRLPDEAVERLREADLQVVLQLGMDDVRGHADVASFGSWALRHGDGERYAGNPPHFWEMVDDSPTTAVTLERRAAEPSDTLVLASAHFATDHGSLVRNRVQPSFGSAFLVVRTLWALHQFGWPHIAARSRPAGPAAVGNPGAGGDAARTPVRAGVPTNLAVIRWLVPRVIGAVGRRLVARLFARDQVEHWQMAIRVGSRGLEPDNIADLSGFRWIESPRGRFYADPFLMERDGSTWLFFEDFPYEERKGVISCAEVGPDGQLGPVRVVLSTEGHLSYPYVFRDGVDARMVPESSAEGTVRLYRATEFPHHWVEEAELLHRPALDSSILEQDGRWWLFTSLREPRGGATMLWLFHAESLSGAWAPHPLNPVSTDVRTARGAGLIHRHRGRLIRPSQDGSRGYGFGFVLNEITTLSTTDYEERPIINVGPGWEPRMLGTHTYNRVGHFEVIDAKFRRPRHDVQ